MIRWLTGLSPKTKDNYIKEIPEYLTFVNMTPTEIISKRMHDKLSLDLLEVTFFENSWREFKQYLESKGTLSDASIHGRLRTVASFFGRNGTTLDLHKGDWEPTTKQPVKIKFKLELEDVKRMYGHASLRDKCLLLILSQSGFSEIDIEELKIEEIIDLYGMAINEHYVITKNREKTNFEQCTCLSYEFLHDLRNLLSEDGNPTKGYIFVPQTRQDIEIKEGMTKEDIEKARQEAKEKRLNHIDTRRINEAISKLALDTFGKECIQGTDKLKAEVFTTKLLRSFYNSALLRAKVQPQEIKDVMMGHQRSGALKNYSYDDITIKEHYINVFEFVSINGLQSREDYKNIKEDMKKQESHFLEIIADLKTENKKMKEEQDQKIAELGTTLKDLANLKVTIGNKVYPLKDIAKLKVPKTEETKE